MTKQEAIERIKFVRCWTDINHNPTVNSYECSLYMNNDGLCDECEYHIALECIEKQIPRKPKAEKVDFDIRVGCPRCGREILYINVIDLEECERYCCNCGQALEIWGDNE